MRIAVLGYGKEGRAAVEYWRQGNDVTVCDVNPDLELPDEFHGRTGPDYLKGLDDFNLIVRSPHIHPRDIVAANDERILRKVTTCTEEFIRNSPAPIIAVTGTKGKGTTSSLITKIVTAAGHRVHLGGNIGIPAIEMLRWNIQPEDWVVLEVSSFQVIDLRVSPKVAVCVMVVPEHLDWHTSLAEYFHSKQNLFRHQSDRDLAVFNRLSDFSAEVVSVSPALKMSYEVPPFGRQPVEQNGAYVLGNDIYMDDERVCSVDDVALLGRHNLENVCAAITATWDLVGGRADVITKAVREFHGMPHRLELVREVHGVKYYDDSFGTTPETATVAIEAIKEPKVLILGGSDKGSSYKKLAETVAGSNVRAVVQIGDMGPVISKALREAGFTNIIQGGDTMVDMIHAATNAAQPGDAVLLSTACASFGLFKDYIDRGDQFHRVVNGLN